MTQILSLAILLPRCMMLFTSAEFVFPVGGMAFKISDYSFFHFFSYLLFRSLQQLLDYPGEDVEETFCLNFTVRHI